MSRSKKLEIGTLIEYYPGQFNYDIGYVKSISKENNKSWYDICWFLGKYDTQEDNQSMSLWEGCKIYRVKYAYSKE